MLRSGTQSCYGEEEEFFLLRHQGLHYLPRAYTIIMFFSSTIKNGLLKGNRYFFEDGLTLPAE